jgi:hypothetical protein
MNTAQPERNPETHTAHKREVALQIILPTMIGLTLLVALSAIVIYAGASGNNEVSRWADISLVWILLPCILAALLFLIILVVLTIGLTKLLSVIPAFAYKLQSAVFKAETSVKKATDLVVRPFVKYNSLKAGARRLLRRR